MKARAHSIEKRSFGLISGGSFADLKFIVPQRRERRLQYRKLIFLLQDHSECTLSEKQTS